MVAVEVAAVGSSCAVCLPVASSLICLRCNEQQITARSNVAISKSRWRIFLITSVIAGEDSSLVYLVIGGVSVTPDPASFPGLRMYPCDFINVKYDHVTDTIPKANARSAAGAEHTYLDIFLPEVRC